MAIQEIPKSYVYTSDVCGLAHEQKNAGGHYSNSRPPHWATLRLMRDAYDYEGSAVADGTVEILLCGDCHRKVERLLNDLKEVTQRSPK